MATSARLPGTCLKLAIVALVLLPISALAVRWQLIHFRWGLLLFALSALTGIVVIATAAFTTRRQAQQEDRQRLSRASLLALPPVAFFALNLFSGANAPLIHDVSTSPDSPLPFVEAAKQRHPEDNSLDPDPASVALQVTAYPDLEPLILELPVENTLELARQLVLDKGWYLYADHPDQGRLEAVAETRWFSFQDDVLILVSLTETGKARVDMRSASRVGKGDLGANARRIRHFLKELEQLAGIRE